MYNTISPNSTGGCRGLINYLEKDASFSERFVTYLDKESELDQPSSFFNGRSNFFDKEEVVSAIDKNASRGLKKNETKFFSLTINPSAREIKHLESLAEKEYEKMKSLSYDKLIVGNEAQIKQALVMDMLKQYTVSGMDQYAQNFGRDGIKSNRDLVWFGRVEKDRYWKQNSKEVQHNRTIDRKIAGLKNEPDSPSRDQKIARLEKEYILESHVRQGGKSVPVREMMPKSGTNYHIHVIVSRKDATRTKSLSPLAKARSNDKHKLNGKEVKIGFNRDSFSQQLETSFDRNFQYTRYYSESYEGRKTMKQNPELYKAREAEYNLANGLKKDRPEREFNHSIEAQAKGLVNSFAQNAGMNYINDAVKPYREILSTSCKGIKLLASSRNNTKQAKSLGKHAAKGFAKGVGMNNTLSQVTKLPSLVKAPNPASLVVDVGIKLVSGLSRGL